MTRTQVWVCFDIQMLQESHKTLKQYSTYFWQYSSTVWTIVDTPCCFVGNCLETTRRPLTFSHKIKHSNFDAFLNAETAFSSTVFPHIVAAATILFWINLVRKLFKFSFPLCNENLNSFLTRWGNYSRRGSYSREETIWGNTVGLMNSLK